MRFGTIFVFPSGILCRNPRDADSIQYKTAGSIETTKIKNILNGLYSASFLNHTLRSVVVFRGPQGLAVPLPTIFPTECPIYSSKGGDIL